MVNTEIRLIMFSEARDGELYIVSKNKSWSWLYRAPYCKIQAENEENRENHLVIQVWSKSNFLWL